MKKLSRTLAAVLVLCLIFTQTALAYSFSTTSITTYEANSRRSPVHLRIKVGETIIFSAQTPYFEVESIFKIRRAEF